MKAGGLIEVSVEVDGEAAEAICELFERYGGGAVVEVRVEGGAPEGKAAADPQAHPQRPGGPAQVGEPDGAGAASALAALRGGEQRSTWVRTYLPAGDVEARRRVEVGLWHLGQIYPIAEPLVRELAEANWAEAWKEHYTPLAVGARFWIVPAWLDPAEALGPAEGLVVRLDPGMAFGTGLHPTTQLCLAALEAEVRPGAAVLDVGTGSGILAIGAARLGAARVVGVDIDAKAVGIAAANAALNGVTPDFRAGPIEAAGDAAFDVVVANILAGTIIDLAAALAARLRPGGVLIASGILTDQGAAVAAALMAAGLRPAGSAASGDWVALTARRPHDG